MIKGGGVYTDTYAACSCGWSAKQNGMHYAEAKQAIKDHLKEVGVYTTQGEQTVYAHLATNLDYGMGAEEIAAKSGRTLGRTKKALAHLIEMGNVKQVEDLYFRTDKWFSWND